MKHIRLFNTLNERTSVVNDHPYDNILSYTKENSGLLISRSMPNDEIWYISSNGNVVTPNSTSGFGANIVSNTYTNGKGVIKFDGPVTSIADNVFNSCENLVTVTIPDSVTSIEDGVFNGCSSLTSVTIPDGVTSIGAGTFKGCSSLTSVTIPDGVTSIGDYAFYNCTGLITVTIPDSVTTIGDYAFSRCTNLVSVTIPDSVTTIGDYAFYNVLNINYNGTATGSPWSARCINGYVEAGLVYTDNTKTILVAADKNITRSVTIPNTVTSIGSYAFNGCRSLTSVTIPNTVTNIGSYAFHYCIGLTSITCNATTPPTLSNTNAFNDTNNCPIYVPAASVDTYKAANNWSMLASRIQAIQS